MGFLDIENFIHENEINTVEIGFADINGVLRGKSIPARYFLKNIHQGFEFANSPFSWDVKCGVYDDIEVGNFENGFSDIVAQPMLTSLRKIPWKEGTAFLFCEIKDTQGNSLEIDPREVLKKVLKEINRLGYRAIVGIELEFYLLGEDKKPIFSDPQCYSLYGGVEKNHIIQEISNAIEAFGINIEAFHLEYGASQMEVVSECGDALDIADQVMLIKYTIKEVARKHGLYATFMPKPYSGLQGSGLHINQSLWDLNLKVNYFEKDKELTQQYLAGLLTCAREFTLLGAPTINAYKRFESKSFAPTHVTAADDNRTVAVRALLDKASASRFEYRLGSSDANPYLIVAAGIAAGTYGLKNKLHLSKSLDGQSYVKRATVMPKSLEEALNLFENNAIAKEHFGEQFVKLYLTLGRHEVELYRSAVTEWERNRYLEII